MKGVQTEVKHTGKERNPVVSDEYKERQYLFMWLFGLRMADAAAAK